MTLYYGNMPVDPGSAGRALDWLNEKEAKERSASSMSNLHNDLDELDYDRDRGVGPTMPKDNSIKSEVAEQIARAHWPDTKMSEIQQQMVDHCSREILQLLKDKLEEKAIVLTNEQKPGGALIRAIPVSEVTELLGDGTK